MIDIIILSCLVGGIITLAILSYIDLKTFLLPNIGVGTFAILGVIFHFTDSFDNLPLNQVIYGALTGFGSLYLIRAAGNWYYKQDSLGLGDVKLLGAGGLWLGVEGVFFAITIGAFAGLLHGIIYALYVAYKTKQPINMTRLKIPAGPGFAIGIVMVIFWQYQYLLGQSVQNIF